jgi:hypothetical protein
MASDRRAAKKLDLMIACVGREASLGIDGMALGYDRTGTHSRTEDNKR